VIACLQRIARLFGWRTGRRQSSLAAEADLRFGAGVELGISDFSLGKPP
jgi:CO/xanthine dehydrogenase Mo-binding subunit